MPIKNKVRLLSIPFDNQDSDFCNLIRRYQDTLRTMHSILNDDVRLPIVMYGEHLDGILDTTHNDENWEGYIIRRNEMIKKLNQSRLTHLSFANFDVDENNVVSLVVCYEGNNLQKYIPPSVRVLYHPNKDIIKKQLESVTNTSDLWWLVAFAFVVPTFGSYQ